MLIALMAVTLFSCKSNTETATTAAATPASSCVKEGPEIDMMKNAIAAYSAGDWAKLATFFSDSAVSYHNGDTVAMKMSDRIELFKKQREALGGTVDPGTPNLEVVTVDTGDEQYKDYKWGHAWVKFTSTDKSGAKKSTLTFASFAIKDGKILWEQVIYDTK